MRLRRDEWDNYINRISKLCNKAADKLKAYVNAHGLDDRKAIIDMSYALVSKYGEASAALACQMVDDIARLSNVDIPATEPAEALTYGDTAKAVNGAIVRSPSGQLVHQTVYRLVKQHAADTVIQAVNRNHAEWAWIPNGDSCPFCIALASRGWQPASRAQMKGNHAEHIHANCDCNFCIRFNEDMNVDGYDPDKYYREYHDAAPHGGSAEKLNAMRRAQYKQNADRINAQKRAAYKANKKAVEQLSQAD